jgi:hypothetical protein
VTTLNEIAAAVKMDVDIVRRILSEQPGMSVTKDTADRVFSTARKLGYDFRKLKIGKRMSVRKEVFDEVQSQIEAHESWGRADILKYIRQSSEMIDRVHKRTFKEEFGAER